MKNILICWFLITAFGASSQCFQDTDCTFNLTTDLNGYNAPNYACNLATDINQLEAYDNFFVHMDFPFDIGPMMNDNDIEVNLYENGVPIDWTNSYISGTGLSLVYLMYRCETPGTRIFKMEVLFTDSGCTDFDMYDTVEVTAPPCPYVELLPIDSSHCQYPDEPMELNLSISDGSASILSTEWSVECWASPYSYGQTGVTNIGTLQGQGASVDFWPPYPGTYHGTGQATILLSDGSTCITDINGTGCNAFLGMFIYSDPFFELSGNVSSGNNIDVIFLGNMQFPVLENPTPTTYYTYQLYDNATLIGSYLNPEYGDILTSFSSLSPGEHEITLIGDFSRTCADTFSITITVSDGTPPEPCYDCNTFKPKPDERYWVSAWVKEDQPTPVVSYSNTSLEFVFTGSGQPAVSFTPTGEIIDGWQRIVGSFTIPLSTTDLDIRLVNDNPSIQAFFDDIRIHPFNASMKSYVYDPDTYWLMAELDDNNYATFYEYSNTGELVRIKKETARGIVTIQESRSSNPKKE